MKYLQRLALNAVIIVTLAGCAGPLRTVKQEPPPVEKGSSYTIKGKTYQTLKKVEPGRIEHGVASWYGPGFHGKKTASGEVYNMFDLTAAHSALPMKTLVKVKNLQNGKEIRVRINDRGPFVDDRVIDLSLAAARELGMVRPGTVPVKLTVLKGSDTLVASRLKEKPSDLGKQASAKGEKDRSPGTPNPFFSGERWGLLALIR
ncbi:MAG: septal ring lytic transglycosylase RlpA family protein [Desulfomonile tiedjei]|nr:septal ring lytic transglycosylase RlpA family protein [Desulfomonile tiedjei]